MIDPNRLLQNIDFDPEFDQSLVEHNEKLGFMVVKDGELASLGLLRVLGFAIPTTREGVFDDSRDVIPLTNFGDLPKEFRTIDRQGKGVGPRLHNTREAIAGMADRHDRVGVYTLDVDPSRIHDGRPTQGNKLARVARHAGRIVRSKLGSVENVVTSVHASYADASVVELELPPHGLIRQKEHGVKNVITPLFMIVRDSNASLHRVGLTTAPWNKK